MKQKVNNNITSNPDGNGDFNNNNDISFNENSIVYTSTQIPNNKNNETSEIDHHIDRLLASIRQSKTFFGEKQIEIFFYCLTLKCIHNTYCNI